jgi:hypothetical protein
MITMIENEAVAAVAHAAGAMTTIAAGSAIRAAMPRPRGWVGDIASADRLG